LSARLLNESQKRSVQVTLQLLEERLAEIEHELTVAERGILYERVARFSPRQVERIRALIAELRQVICEMAEQFQLEREIQSPARRILGLMAITWESLEELHSKRLTAYGAVDPQLPAVIDPWADRLTRLVREVEAVAAQPRVDWQRGQASESG